MPSRFRYGAREITALVSFCLFLWTACAHAATSTWNVSSGNWSVAANWSPSGVPGASAVVDILNTDAISRTITYDYTGAAITLGSLTIDNAGGGTDTLSMAANTLTSNIEYIGDSGAGSDGIGVFNQTGGANNITTGGELYLGFNTTDQGTYDLSSNASLTVTGVEFVGYSGTGTVNQSGGTNTINGGYSLILGENTGSNGTYNLSAGALSVTDFEFIGYQGAGTFNQTGGTNTLNSTSALYIGYATGSNGTYTDSNGTFTVSGTAYVGSGGTGNLNLSGATVPTGTAIIDTINGNLFLGYSTGGVGTVTVGGPVGLVVNSNVYVGGTASAAAGKGVLTVSGSLTIPSTGTLQVYNTSGNSLSLTGGSIETGTLNLSGNPALFTWSSTSGGTVDLTNESVTIDSTAAANFGDSAGGFSSLTLAASQTLQVSGNETVGFNGTGTFNLAGPNTVGGNLVIGSNAGSTGAFSLTGVGALTVNGNAYVGGNSSAAGGKGTLSISSPASLSIPSTGSLTVYNTAGSGLTLSGGSISTGSLNLSGNVALFNWTAGSLSLTNQSIIIDNTAAATFGDSAETAGAFTLSSAQNLTVSGNETIGFNGTASFTQSGGTNLLNGAQSTLYLGFNTGSSATYTLSGAAVLSVSSDQGELVGDQGPATFNQTGGTNIIGGNGNSAAIIVGGNIGGTGTYSLSGNAALSVTGIEAMGVFATGTFTQTGGTNTVLAIQSQTCELDLGYASGGSGTYTISAGTLSDAAGLNVGGNGQGAGGTGVLNVSGTSTVTIGGALTIFNTPGTSVKFSGGTINTAALNFNGIPFLLNWTAGTLNITSNVTWDSAAANTTTSDAFLNSLTLGSNQTLMVTGNETIGGVGGFSLTLNSGSTHYVTDSITLSPTGSITQNPASTLYYSSFTQAGGTVSGSLQNQGDFIYQSGLFSGRLINQGFLNLGPAFTAGNGIENDTSMSVSSGQTVTVNGAGLDNLGFLDLFGGVIAGASATNDFSGNMNAFGSINAPFTNDGNLTVNGVLHFNGTFSNPGTVEGNGDIVGTFSNTAGGSVDIEPDDTLAISTAWTNSSLVNLEGSGAVLGGGALTNTGTIQGAGTVDSPITNTSGVIRASSGELDLGGAGNTNGASAQIQAATGDTVLEIQGLATNAGEIALTGGTFDNNNHTLTNTGYISGNGTFRSGGLTNNGFMVLGGDTDIYGPVTNGATGAVNAVGPGPIDFYGAVTNSAGGNITVQSGASVTFYNSFTGTAPISNGGTVIFSLASISGAITGGGQTVVGNGATTTLKMAVTSGDSSQSSLLISDGSTLDLTNNTFYIDYGSATDPIATIAAYLKSGFNGGSWNGPGIISSTAAATPGYGVGYADSADPGNPAALAPGTIEIKYTLLGDANLDGIVNGIDFGILAANFNKGVTGWDKGDFNYDNVVNGIDFGELAANFNKGATGADIGPGPLSDPALVAFAEANGLMVDVPEPATFALAAIAGAIVLRRRHRA